MIIRVLNNYDVNDKISGYENLINLHYHYLIMCEEMFDKLSEDDKSLAIEKLRDIMQAFSDLVDSENVCVPVLTKSEKLIVLELDDRYSDYALSVRSVFEENEDIYVNTKVLRV